VVYVDYAEPPLVGRIELGIRLQGETRGRRKDGGVGNKGGRAEIGQSSGFLDALGLLLSESAQKLDCRPGLPFYHDQAQGRIF
jgi:hypothetical protein